MTASIDATPDRVWAVVGDLAAVNTWIPIDRVAAIVQPELLFLVLSLALSSWVFYRLFLKGLSPGRHHNIKILFRNLLIHCANLLACCIGFWMLRLVENPSNVAGRVIPYLGLFALVWGCIVLIKTMRIATFEYHLFFGAEHVGAVGRFRF